MESTGMDSDGREFRNAEEMWREAIGDGDLGKKSEWYQKGVGYWEGVEASVDGVLGGYGCVNDTDIKGSEAFFKTLLSERFGSSPASNRHLVALDCGSGIGRVTKNLLLRYFNELVGGMESTGMDSDGQEFRNAEEMWREAIGDGDLGKKSEWYQKGVGYWEGVEASVDGVLGGYGCVDDTDIKGSEAFLKTLLSERFGSSPSSNRHLVALDCGSGIGRVTKNLLLRYFNEVDLVEPVSHFLEAARTNLDPELGTISADHKAANFYCVPLQDFTPKEGRYDVIWVQWCIGQLADDDFVSFFKRAKAGLKPDGLFVLKENIAKSGFVLDKDDKSITRSDIYFKELFNRCGLHLYKLQDQKGFPQELFAVKMYALVTDTPKRTRVTRCKQANRPAIIK